MGVKGGHRHRTNNDKAALREKAKRTLQIMTKLLNSKMHSIEKNKSQECTIHDPDNLVHHHTDHDLSEEERNKSEVKLCIILPL